MSQNEANIDLIMTIYIFYKKMENKHLQSLPKSNGLNILKGIKGT